MRPVSQRDYEERLNALYPALLNKAMAACGQDGEDVLQAALYNATVNLSNFDEIDEETGPGRFANWLFTILRHAIADYYRQRRRQQTYEAESIDARPSGAYGGWEVRLAALYAIEEREALADAELVNEVRLRLRCAVLSREESVCLTARLNGVRLRVVAKELGISKPTCCRRIQSAVEKLRAVEIREFSAAMEAPDLDRYEWRVGTQATIYHAPPTTGSQLARERLEAL